MRRVRGLRWGLGAVVLAAAGGCQIILGVTGDDVPLPAGGGGSGSHCSNGKSDGDETGKDCGGSCTPCPDGEGCKTGLDCESKSCSPGALCVSPTCADEVTNGDETDVDCGGQTCGGCGPGQTCKVDDDCKVKQCADGKCASTCTDGLTGGHETDVDCGGGATSGCPACVDGKRCEVDEDCESAVCIAETCAGNYAWAVSFAPSAPGSALAPSAVAADPSGAVLFAGTFVAPVSLGGPDFNHTGSFLAKIDKAGAYVWSVAFGDEKPRTVAGLAVDAAGHAVVAGSFSGNAGFGSAYASAGGTDAFVAAFDAAGTVQWARRYGDAADQQAVGAAFDAAGDLVIGGDFQGTIDLGGGPHVSSGHSDVFVAKLDAAGGHLWSRRFGGAGYEFAAPPVVDGSGAIVIGGGYDWDFTIGSTLPAGLGMDGFVAKLAPDGTPQWAKHFGGAYDDVVTALATDAAGNVFVAGLYTGEVDFGGGPVEDLGADAIFLVKLGPEGAFQWAKVFGHTPGKTPSLGGMTVTPKGGVVLTGRLREVTAFGGPPLTSAGSDDVFLAVLDASGAHQWSRHYGDPEAQWGTGVAHVNDHAYAIVGGFTGSLTFGAQTLKSSGPGGFLAEVLLP